MISRNVLFTYLLVVLLYYVKYTNGAYTVTVDQYNNLPMVYGSAYTSVNGTIYSYGGKTINTEGLTFDSGDLYQVAIPSPTTNGSDVSYRLLSSHGNSSYGNLVYLPRTQSLLMLGGAIPTFPNVSYSSALVLSMYHLENSTWSSAPVALTSPVPSNRQRFGAAFSTVTNLVYIYGGLGGYTGDAFLSDFWSYDPVSGVFTNLTSTLPYPAGQASSLVSLSYVQHCFPPIMTHVSYIATRNGNLMVLFGVQRVNDLDAVISASKIPTFNVRTNQWSLTITQTPGYERCGATTMLSPNESSIVAFGGKYTTEPFIIHAVLNPMHIIVSPQP